MILCTVGGLRAFIKQIYIYIRMLHCFEPVVKLKNNINFLLLFASVFASVLLPLWCYLCVL